MAAEDRDLSTRMSAEAQNNVKENAGMLFKRHKVEISSAIKTPFPFLEILRDRGFITDEKYKESRENMKRISLQEVVYDILDDLEKTFDLPLLNALFSKVHMEMYPALSRSFRIFINEIPNIKDFLESDAEENEGRSDVQQSLEQGPGETSYPKLPGRSPLSLTYTVTSSEDSSECRNREEPPEASTSAVKRKPGSKKHKEEFVDFHSETLPVTCGDMKGMLHKNKVEEGYNAKCIETEDGNWLLPKEFALKGGYNPSSHWTKVVCCGGKPLSELMKEGKLPTCRKNTRKETGRESPLSGE